VREEFAVLKEEFRPDFKLFRTPPPSLGGVLQILDPARLLPVVVLLAVFLTPQPPPEGDWPNVRIDDAYTRDAAVRAVKGAADWLTRPKCQTLFLEFKDERQLPLSAKLRELETDPEGYLRLVVFLDGARSPACSRHGVLAFTARGSRVVYLCGRDFERAWRRDAREVRATIIHELLHSLGLGENPPAPREITHRVQSLCWS
jgi:hypothetical protein